MESIGNLKKRLSVDKTKELLKMNKEDQQGHLEMFANLLENTSSKMGGKCQMVYLSNFYLRKLMSHYCGSETTLNNNVALYL